MSVSGCIPFYLITWLTEMKGILGESIYSSSGLISTKYTPNRYQGELGKTRKNMFLRYFISPM